LFTLRGGTGTGGETHRGPHAQEQLRANVQPARSQGYQQQGRVSEMSFIKGYFLEEEEFQKLRNIERRLHAGSDAMRDEGHKLWLVLNRLEDHNAVSFDYKTSKLTWEV